MENASKALIIAGAILLAILLISLGILIFNQAQDTVSNSGMGQAEAQSFNSKFTKYEGTVKGSVAKSLVQEVNASNADDNNVNAGRKITMIGVNATTGGAYKSSTLDTSKSYKVEITDYKDGYVSQITITDASSKN